MNNLTQSKKEKKENCNQHNLQDSKLIEFIHLISVNHFSHILAKYEKSCPM